MKFLGIDLGWTSGASGLCYLLWENGCLRVLDLADKQAKDDILTWVDAAVAPDEPALIAVDAPTLIPNTTGIRLPDRLSHRYFHRYHAGCYPANLQRPFARRTVAFGLSLERRGFVHGPAMKARELGRYQIEVFPHPAIVHLFNLPRILKYKKGRLAQRQGELKRLGDYIANGLPSLEPRLEIGDRILSTTTALNQPLKGKELKAIEDRLDSLICAYVAAYWWYWGQARNWVLGDAIAGYIIVPAPRHRPPE